MKEDIWLSIIIPVYNLENYIVPCIESVIHNEGVSPDSFEIVVVNDGSTDLSRQRVEEYIDANLDYHISLYNQENKGVSAARNLGLEKAQGKYVWFVDGDDAVYRRSIYYLTEVIRKFEVEVIGLGGYIGQVLYEDNAVVADYKNDPDSDKYLLLRSYQLLNLGYSHGHQNYIWKREFLLRHRLSYPEHISQNEDFDFLLNAFLMSGNAYINPTYNFYFYRERSDSVSRKKMDYLGFDKYLRNKFSVLEDILKLRRLYKNDDSEKVNVLERYADRYIYFIVADCFFRRLPFPLTLYTIRKLRAMQLYPINRVEGVSSFRIWLFNRWFLFRTACLIYKLFKF